MASYYLNEAVVDLPDRPFIDKTIHGLESKLPGEKTLGVFVHRRPIEAGADLRALVDENVALNQKRLMRFAVLDETSALVGGRPGILLRTSWRRDQRDLYQLQAHVALRDKLMIVAVAGPLEERGACDETFDSILSTISWREA